MRTFKSLSEQEILALAISLEEEDARIYDDFAQGLQADFPVTAKILQQMRAEPPRRPKRKDVRPHVWPGIVRRGTIC